MDRTLTRRKINYKFLLCLLAAGGVLLGGLFAVHFFQSRRIAQALLWQANRAEDEGHIERMARYLERYREFAPNDLVEAARLGKTWAGETFAGNYRVRRRAVFLLDNVLRDDPSRADLRRLLVR